MLADERSCLVRYSGLESGTPIPVRHSFKTNLTLLLIGCMIASLNCVTQKSRSFAAMAIWGPVHYHQRHRHILPSASPLKAEKSLEKSGKNLEASLMRLNYPVSISEPHVGSHVQAPAWTRHSAKQSFADMRYQAELGNEVQKPQPPVSQEKRDKHRHIFGYGDVPSDFGR